MTLVRICGRCGQDMRASDAAGDTAHGCSRCNEGIASDLLDRLEAALKAIAEEAASQSRYDPDLGKIEQMARDAVRGA